MYTVKQTQHACMSAHSSALESINLRLFPNKQNRMDGMNVLMVREGMKAAKEFCGTGNGPLYVEVGCNLCVCGLYR